MLQRDGIAEKEDIAQVTPQKERLSRGAVAIYECFQQIPCNACEKVCPQKAVTIGTDINNIPLLDAEKCIGCGECILTCPGQATFVIDMAYSAAFALVKMPFEFVPRPEREQYALGLDRSGAELGWFEIEEVRESAGTNKTCLISLKVPHPLAMQVRNIKVGDYK